VDEISALIIALRRPIECAFLRPGKRQSRRAVEGRDPGGHVGGIRRPILGAVKRLLLYAFGVSRHRNRGRSNDRGKRKCGYQGFHDGLPFVPVSHRLLFSSFKAKTAHGG